MEPALGLQATGRRSRSIELIATCQDHGHKWRKENTTRYTLGYAPPPAHTHPSYRACSLPSAVRQTVKLWRSSLAPDGSPRETSAVGLILRDLNPAFAVSKRALPSLRP